MWAMIEKLRMNACGPSRDRATLCSIGRNCLRIFRPDVVRARTDQAVVGVLLEHVRGPAGDAAHGEDRRVEVHRNARARRTSTPNRSPRSRRASSRCGRAARSAATSRTTAAGRPFRRAASRTGAGASRADPRCGRRDGRSRKSSPCGPGARGRRPRRAPAPASLPMSSSIFMTSALAPPCSGPFSVADRGRRSSSGCR